MEHKIPRIVDKARNILRACPTVTMKEMAQTLGVSQSYIWQLNNDHCIGIATRSFTRLSADEKEDLRRKYREGWAMSDISEYYGVSSATVLRAVGDLPKHNRVWVSSDELKIVMMLAEGKKYKEIAHSIGETSTDKIKNRTSKIRKRYGNAEWSAIIKALENDNSTKNSTDNKSNTL